MTRKTLRAASRLLLLVAVWLTAGPALAQRTDLRVDSMGGHYTFNADGTYVAELWQDLTVLTPDGRSPAGQTQFRYHPDSTSQEVLEALVVQPDGTAVPVPPDTITTRPSAVAQRSQGFSNEMTTTIVFPQLQVGSRTKVRVRQTVMKPLPVGFNMLAVAPLSSPTERMDYRFDLPAGTNFQVAERGGVALTDKTRKGRRVVTAVMERVGRETPEPGTPASSDYMPIVAATTLASWEEVGAIYHAQSKDKAVPTPEIAALARQVAEGRDGAEAVRAVYDWVVANIRYVQVYLDPAAGYVPNPAAEVLRRRYGDCKDYVVLMQAMLASLGIEAHPVLVGWGNAHAVLPVTTAYQFNHAMIHVPAHGIWANPTDTMAPMGTMDHGLAGKLVVVAAEKPWTATLPSPPAEANLYRQVDRVTLTPEGGFVGKGRIDAAGTQDISLRRTFSTGKPTRELADDILRGRLQGGFGDLRHADPRDLSTPMWVETEWESPEAVAMTDRILLDRPTGIGFYGIVGLGGIQTRDRRDFPFLLNAGRAEFVTELTLPPGYRAASLPRDVVLENDSGSYRASYRAEAGRVTVSRILTLNRAANGPEHYPQVMALVVAIRHDVAGALEIVRERVTDRAG